MIDRIPELMRTISGEKIITIEEWEKYRRPEIMCLFENYVYGVRPVEKPEDLRFDTEAEIENFCVSGVDFKKINISFCGYSFPVYGYLPHGKKKKVPAFIYIMHEYESDRFDFTSQLKAAFIDVERITQRGYAVFIMPTAGIAPDGQRENRRGYDEGVYTVFMPDSSKRKANTWATISSWSWGVSRVLDYLETDDSIDEKKVSVAGHSRGGKTALWCGATDMRVMCSISNNSGCTGAAMHRTKGGEHVKDINITDWFCENYRRFNDNERFLPVDQHMLLGALAPRLAYVSSSSEDSWADPAAERLSCIMAKDAYELYGKPGVVLPDGEVKIDTPYHDGSIGYHVKSGEHSITCYDWEMFMDFLDKKIEK